MFVRVIPEHVVDEISFLIFLLVILNRACTRISSFIFLVTVFFNSFLKEFVIEFANDLISLIGGIVGPNRNRPNCTF